MTELGSYFTNYISFHTVLISIPYKKTCSVTYKAEEEGKPKQIGETEFVCSKKKKK